MIGNLCLVEFSGDFSFSSFFSLVVLASWVGCLLLDILLGCLCLLTVGYLYQDAIQSLHFLSFILKIQKIYILCYWHLIFWVLVIDISTCMERLHLILKLQN
jgi:hypothetical protein